MDGVVRKKTVPLRRLIPLILSIPLLFLSTQSQAIAPLFGPQAKSCSTKMLHELDPLLQLMQAQLSENTSVSNITVAASDGRPFKAGANVTCQTSLLVGDLTAFRCTGTMGSPCGVLSEKKFLCHFLDSHENEGFHNNATETNTTAATLPTQIQCKICIEGMAAADLTRLQQFHNLYTSNGEAILIDDPTGTTCW